MSVYQRRRGLYTRAKKLGSGRHLVLLPASSYFSRRIRLVSEKAALRKAVLSPATDADSLLGCQVRQPFTASFFKEDQPKDIEWRTRSLATLKREYKYVALLSSRCCPYFDKDNLCACFLLNSQKAAAKYNDDTLLEPRPCLRQWRKDMVVVDRNGGKPRGGFPYSAIEGIILFEGEIEGLSVITKHPWYVEGFGGYGWKVKKVIKLASPILRVTGAIQGLPVRMYSLLGIDAE